MQAGIYLNETGNLLIIYPKNLFLKERTSFDVYKNGKFVKIHLEDKTLSTLEKVMELEYIGELWTLNVEPVKEKI